MKSKKALQALVDKFLSGHHSREELEELLRYFAIQDGNEAQLKEIITAYVASPEEFDETTLKRADDITRQTDQYLHELVQERQPVIRRMIHWKRYLTVAAISFSLLAAGVWLYLNSQETKNSEQLTSHYGDDVLPGGNNAILTLADGRTIQLDSAANGLLAEQSGNSITNNKDGILTYQAESANGTDAATTEFNTITTPKGGQYRVTLPDGTKVWLNAASSLTYPIRFAASNERKVKLAGEAYFEVHHNEKHRFVVASGDQLVQVLGTDFNINAYESQIVTTLVQGSVRLDNKKGNTTMLQPNQQAIFDNNSFTVSKVDVTDFVAWKDGLIIINNATLTDVIRQVERWYDVEFEVGQPPATTAYVALNQKAKLSEVLEALELNYGIKFRIEGRKVIERK